jgi:hypothetical protein
MKTSVLVVAAAALAGCGGGTSITQACTDIATARCNKLVSCTNAGNPSGFTIVKDYGDLPTCIMRETLACSDSQSAPHQGSTPDLVEMCSKMIPSVTCTDYLNGNLSGPCAQAMGPLGNGASCTFAGQCSTGACNGAKHAACGTCGAAPAAGADCSTSACARGLDCVSQTSTASPPPMLCVADGGSGAMCNRDNPCSAGFGCIGATKTTMGTCMADAEKVGAACDPTFKTGPDCDGKVGLWCNTMTSMCTAVLWGNDGDNCGLGADGNVTSCKAGDCIGATFGANPMPGQCKAKVLEGSGCDIVNGPLCTAPAKCVLTNGTAGICTLADGTKC